MRRTLLLTGIVLLAAGVGPVQYEYTRGIDSGEPRTRTGKLLNYVVANE